MKYDVWNTKKKKKASSTNQWISTLVVMIFVLVIWVLTLLAKNNPQAVEGIYSSTIYPYIARGVSCVSGVISISVAEAIIILISLSVIIFIVLVLIRPRLLIANIKVIFHWVIRAVGLIYILFYLLWGFNYYRVDYIDLAGMSKETASIGEFKDLCKEIIAKANEARQNVEEDEYGVFVIKDSFEQLSKQARQGFEDFTVGELKLNGKYGRAKPILNSRWMAYTGITGVYFPYTSEPNVSVDIPYAIIPATISHEMAHQRGFAKEQEANFIAYKACIRNPDQRFQYSGYYFALKYLMSDLRKMDPEAYQTLAATISDPVKRDLHYEYNYWKAREGKIEEVANAMNNNYLKANNQASGVQSYDGVVQLLVAEYKTTH